MIATQLDASFKKNVSLAELTTLGVGGRALYFFALNSESQIPDLVTFAKENCFPIFVLGEGSNVLISDSGVDGLVIKMENKGIDIVSETAGKIRVRVQAGHGWDDFVAYSVAKGWWGAENMSLIPGTVGACPVQNVGAYGQECKRIIACVNAYDTHLEEFVVIANEACRFGFRESIFNTTSKDRYIISSVEFELNKEPAPCLSRPEVRKGLRDYSPSTVSQQDIRDLIIKYRTSGKSLPNSPSLGSAGTFYRTTVVSFRQLLGTFAKSLIHVGPKIAITVLLFGWRYRNSQGYRIPSRMLIDACEASSLRVNDVSLYRYNSAVLITKKDGNPSAKDIVLLTRRLRKIVYDKTGFRVPIEPTLVGYSDAEIKMIFGFSK